MLPEGSNILAFQSLFDFTGEDCSSSGYIEWIFKRKYEDFRDLPEDTTLQRNLKKYLLAGNILSVGKGVLKKELLLPVKRNEKPTFSVGFYTSIPNAPLTKSPIAKEIKATPKLIALIWKNAF